ncbi:hypothetical protein Ctob_009717 [Chrysochromulina tobinii]|uniref:Uncharacterized protein n=1 Tax=Chrysochromulina tobinii TaxID=1460289 RepID=A0A0M0JT58_9EUKA|nr:hypothetical protein Ctob_009717 [Chrysochromulina tobinii]|eukprot:KOO29457.1 hypothetical protein Ctob_009717 [Chrysochromulina sp. CCMP291]
MLRHLEAFGPVALLGIHLDALGQVAAVHEVLGRAALGERALVRLGHVALHLGSDLLGELARIVPQPALHVHGDRLAVLVDALVQLGRLGEPVDLDEALGDGLDHLGDARGHVVHGELDCILPHLLQEVVALGLRGGHLQVRIDRLGKLARFLELTAARHEHLLRLGRRLAALERIVLRHQLLHLVRQELARDAQRVVPARGVLVGLDRELGLLCAHVERLGLGELGALDARLRLRDEHVGHRARVVGLGHARRVRPVLLVHIHVDRLLRLIGLDELLLGIGEAPLVFEIHRVLEVHLGQLVLARVLRERERVLEGAALGRVVDRLLDEPKLGEQLGSRLAAERDRPRVRHLLGRVRAAVALRHPNGLVPQVVGAVHVDRRAPVVGLNVVALGQLEVAFGLKLLRQVQVRLREQLLAVRGDQPDHVVVPPVLLVHVDGEVS